MARSLVPSSLRAAARRLAAYNAWPVIRLAEDIEIADRSSWLQFLRESTDEELLYAVRVLRARTCLVGAPAEIRALLGGEVSVTHDAIAYVPGIHPNRKSDVARAVAVRMDTRAGG